MNPLIIAGAIVLFIVIGVGVYPAFKVMPYAYGSARIRAAKARMFKDEELAALAGEPYKDAIYHLEKRGLTDLLDLIDTDFREELVQKRLRRDYLEQLHKISKYVPSWQRKFFQVLRERNVFEFILAVIRSKTNPYHSRHVIEDLFVGSEDFKQSEIERIEELSLDEFTSRLKDTRYHDVISKHMDEIRKGDLVSFEQEMNAMFFEQLGNAARGDSTLQKYAKFLIDVHNIRTAFCFGNDVFVSGGTLSSQVLREMDQASEMKEVIRALEKTKYYSFIKDVETIIEAQQALLRAEKAHAATLMKNQPLSIDPILAYYIQKRIELQNVQILLKLTYARFAPEQVRAMLV